MNKTNLSTALFVAVLIVAATCMPFGYASPSVAQQQPAIAKSIGSVKSISGNVITLAPVSGPELTVTVQPNARILKLGADKDLKNAAPIQLADIQVGDNIRARGAGSADGKSISALEIIVITSSAVASVSDQMRQDWQKRGIGGIVSAVDPAAGTVTITTPSLTDKKTTVVHASKATVIKRYAPDSAKYENAKPSSLDAIHAGDQLRARGDRSPDGNDFTAVEILAGAFPYVEGPIKSVDASSNTLTVQDVLTKKPVQLKISSESQLHQVPAEMAQRMAFMLKAAKSGTTPTVGTAASAAPNAAGNAPAGTPPAVGNPVPPGAGAPGYGGPGPGGSGTRTGGAGGLQRMLDQTPATTLNDLHKGDVIAILATEGTSTGGGTVLKLFSGVEPILTAAPSASQAMMLTPWSLGGGAPGGDQ